MKKRVWIFGSIALLILAIGLTACRDKDAVEDAQSVISESEEEILPITGLDLTEVKESDAVTKVAQISCDAKYEDKYFMISNVMNVGDHILVEYTLSEDQIAGTERGDEPEMESYIGVLDLENKTLQNVISLDLNYSDTIYRSLENGKDYLWYIEENQETGEKTCTKYDDSLQVCGLFTTDQMFGYFSEDGSRYYYVENNQVVWMATDSSGESGTLESSDNFIPENADGIMTLGDGHDGLFLLGRAGDLKDHYAILDVQENSIVYWEDGQDYNGMCNDGIFWENDYSTNTFYCTDFSTGVSIAYPEESDYYPSVYKKGDLILIDSQGALEQENSSWENIAFVNPDSCEFLGGVRLGETKISYSFLSSVGTIPGTHRYLIDINNWEEGDSWYIVDADKLDADSLPEDTLVPDVENWTAESEAPKSLDSYDLTEFVPGEVEAGLEDCRTYADELEQKYGVGIYISNECRMVWGNFAVMAMNDESLIMDSLNALDEELAKYPDGFIRQLQWNDITGVDFYIAGQVFGVSKDVDSISLAGGFQDQGNGRDMIVISVDEYTGIVNSTIHHELSHTIDAKLESDWDSAGYIDPEVWNQLNPDGFEYLYSYRDWEDSTDESLNEYTMWYDDDADVYFIDSYSKTFPTEDRARLFEYVMTDMDFTGYPEMVDKLNAYAEKIRAGFDTTGWGDVLWEKYMQAG